MGRFPAKYMYSLCRWYRCEIILKGGEKNGNSHSFIHAFSPSSGSKLPTLLCSGLSLPIASANLKSFPPPLAPPHGLTWNILMSNPTSEANLQLPATKPYCECSPMRMYSPSQALALDLTECFCPSACHAISFLSSMTAAVCHRNVLAWSLSHICLLVDLQKYMTSTHHNN